MWSFWLCLKHLHLFLHSHPQQELCKSSNFLWIILSNYILIIYINSASAKTTVLFPQNRGVWKIKLYNFPVQIFQLNLNALCWRGDTMEILQESARRVLHFHRLRNSNENYWLVGQELIEILTCELAMFLGGLCNFWQRANMNAERL
jgi:hypothetical protein